MIGTIRKHQKWLWIIIIIVTIVTFVFFFSPSGRSGFGGGGQPAYDFGTINGQPITARQYQDAKTEESLVFFFATGEWPKQEDRLRQMGFDLEARTYQRLLMNAKAIQNNIYVNEDAIVRQIKLMYGLDSTKTLPLDEYKKLLTRLAQNDVSESDFQRYVAHQVAHQQLVTAFGLGGSLIGPKEAEALYRRENQPISSLIVRFTTNNFISQVTSTPKDLEAFFTNNQSAYRIPEKIQVNYVKFDVTNYFAEVDKTLAGMSNLTEMIAKSYAQQGPDAYKDDAGKPLSADDAKAKMRSEFRTQLANKAAQRKAIEFLTKIYDKYTDKNAYSIGAFAEMAKADGLTVQTTESFDASKGPNLKVPKDFVQRAFRLGEDPADASKKTLFSTTPILAEDGVYAISLQSRTLSQPLPLAQVRAEVEADYARDKAFELASIAGERFEMLLTNGLAAGKSFEAICAEANVKPEALTPFSLTSKVPDNFDKSEFEQLQQVAYGLANGKASRLMPARYGGFVLYVKERLAVDDAKMKTELPSFIAKLREQRQSAAFSEWLQQQFSDLRRPVQATAAKSKG